MAGTKKNQEVESQGEWNLIVCETFVFCFQVDFLWVHWVEVLRIGC